jgi:Domain of unknown function (DUF1992)
MRTFDHTFDSEIGRQLQAAADKGELKSAKGYGKPLEETVGWNDTPADLRMPFKILKDAGTMPPEIALFHERARLRAAMESAITATEREKLQRQLSELEQRIALRLEAMRGRSLR